MPPNEGAFKKKKTQKLFPLEKPTQILRLPPAIKSSKTIPTMRTSSLIKPLVASGSTAIDWIH